MTVLPRILLTLAGLVGAIGIASAAGASHGDSRNLSSIATVFLAHAPVLVALGLLARGRVLLGTAVVLALGTLVFGGDLAMREWMGQSLFPMAAPLGGGLMILGWLGIALAGATGLAVQSINKD